MKRNYREIVDTLPHSMKRPKQHENCPTLEQAVAYINSMDFSLIRGKHTSDDRLLCRQWSAIEIEVGIQYYKNFLFLNKKHIENYPVIPPSLETDEIWHHHILDTRQYTKDCDNIFGYYFHHYPYFGTRGQVDKSNLGTAFEITQQLHEIEFGCRIVSIWGDEIDL